MPRFTAGFSCIIKVGWSHNVEGDFGGGVYGKELICDPPVFVIGGVWRSDFSVYPLFDSQLKK